MATLMPQGKQQYFSNAGAPLVGGKVYTYAAGTSTPLATYADKAGATPNTNPVVLDSRGEASMFWAAAGYKVVLKDSTDATIWTQDNLWPDMDASITVDASLMKYTPAGTGAVSTNVSLKLQQIVNVSDYGGVADGKRILDATMTYLSSTLTSATANFTSADIGKRILVYGAAASPNSLVATITGRTNATTVTLSQPCSYPGGVAGVEAHYGTDNTTAFQNAVTYLYGLGGGTLKCQGTYLICNGPDGNDGTAFAMNLAFQYCSNITFDWSGATILGTISFNTNNGTGVGNVQTVNMTSIGGTFYGVGQRLEAPMNSTIWNMMVLVYGKNCRILDPVINVPPGARALSLQTDTSVAAATSTAPNLQDIYARVQIEGPSVVANQYLCDGIDLLTASQNYNFDGITIEGVVRNVGRGVATQDPGGTYYNYNLKLNLTIINPRQVGAVIANVTNLDYDLNILNVNPDVNGTYTYKGDGFISYGCEGVQQNRLQVVGANISTLNVAVEIGTTAPNDWFMNNTTITMTGASYKWGTGILVNGSETIWQNTVVAGCTKGIDLVSASNTVVFQGLVTRGNTADLATNAILAKRSGVASFLNYQPFAYSATSVGPAYELYTTGSGRFRYSTVPIGSVAYASAGTNSTYLSSGGCYKADVFIPRTMTLTGIAVLNGATVGTNKVVYVLYNDVGQVVATTAVAGTTTAGANTFQTIPFTAPYTALGPAQFWIGVQANGTTDSLQTIPANTFIDVQAQYDAGTFGAPASFAINGTFAASQGPIAYVY